MDLSSLGSPLNVFLGQRSFIQVSHVNQFSGSFCQEELGVFFLNVEEAEIRIGPLSLKLW